MRRIIAFLLAVGLLCAGPVQIQADAAAAAPDGTGDAASAPEAEAETSAIPEAEPTEEQAPEESAAPEETAAPEPTEAPEETSAPEETPEPTPTPTPTPKPTPTPTPAPTPTPVYPAFEDVPKDLNAAVSYAVAGQLMEETSPFTFSPDLVLSRASAVTVLYNLAGRPEAKAPKFPDVPGDWWYADAIGWASTEGLISGYGDGRFGPKDPLTREQLACILYAYQKKGGGTRCGRRISPGTMTGSL